MSEGVLFWIGFSVYLAIVLLIGVLTHIYRRSRTLADYLVGGKIIGPLTTAFTTTASIASGYQFVGLVGTAFLFGFASFWFLVGDLIGVTIQYAVAPRFRKFTGRLNSITIVDYLADRVEDTGHVVRALAAIIVFVFMSTYVCAQFTAGGKAFVGLGASYDLGVFVTWLIVTVYTLLGGYLAVAYTDTLQGIWMLIGMYTVIPLAIASMGGWHAFISRLAEQSADLLSATNGMSLEAFLLFMGTIFGIGVGYPGSPHSMGRMIGVRSPKAAAQAGIIAVISWILIDTGSIFLGLTARAMMPTIADPETSYMVMVRELVPPIAAGLMLAAVYAAIMSTADSQLLAAVGALVRDIFQRILNPNADEKKLVALSRILVVAISVAGLVIALRFSGAVFWFILFAWSGVACVFAPIVVLSLYWKRLTKWGVVAAMIGGSTTAVIWHFTPVLKEAVYEGFPAAVVSFLLAVVVSLLTKPPEKVIKILEGVW